MTISDAEIDEMIKTLELARGHAIRAKRAREEGMSDGEAQLRTVRSTVLPVVRTIANHFPPFRSSIGV